MGLKAACNENERKEDDRDEVKRKGEGRVWEGKGEQGRESYM